MQEVRAGDRPDAYGFAAYPFSATPCQEFLIQRMSGIETLFGYVERLRLCLARIHVINRGGVAEEKTHFVEGVNPPDDRSL